MLLDGTVETFIAIVFNYPTLAETFKYAAYDALGRLGPPGPVASADGPPSLRPMDRGRNV